HEQDAEDAFQAAFLTLSRKANSISQRECVAGWLYRVTHRLALELKGSCVKYSARLTPLGDVAGAVSEMHVWRDTRYVLDEELQKLPAKYRDPFVLCYLEGKTNDQAARELGCPRGTVATRLAWARQRLRSRLTRRGLALPAGFFA